MRRALGARARAAAIMSLILTAWVGLSIGAAEAACAAPMVSIDGARVRQADAQEGREEVAQAGSRVDIIGEGFFAECNDTPGPCEQGGVSGPMEGVHIGIVPAQRTSALSGGFGGWVPAGDATLLGIQDADDDFGFRLDDVALPSTPGPYLLVASIADSGDYDATVHVILTGEQDHAAWSG